MPQHVKWKYPDREDDYNIHMIGDSVEFTLCGLAYEGEEMESYSRAGYDEFQEFVVTNEKVNCRQCKNVFEHCRKMRQSEFE